MIDAGPLAILDAMRRKRLLPPGAEPPAGPIVPRATGPVALEQAPATAPPEVFMRGDQIQPEPSRVPSYVPDTDFEAPINREFYSQLLPTPATDKYRAMAEQGPSEHKPGGFWARMKDALLAGSLAARRGGEAGGLGGLGGFIGGAVAGGINPEVAHRLRYEDVELPRAFQKAKAEQGLLGEDIKRAMALANMSGINPYTGEPTDAAANRVYNRELARRKVDISAQTAANTAKDKERRASIQQLNAVLRARQQGGTLTPDEIESIRGQYGIQLPPTYDPKKHHVVIGADGVARVVDLNELGPITEGGKPLQTMQGRQETERERAAREREALGRQREGRLAEQGAAGPRPNKTVIGSDVGNDWRKAGKTPSGKTINPDGTVTVTTKDKYGIPSTKDVPLESTAEYKRAVNDEYSKQTRARTQPKTAPSQPSQPAAKRTIPRAEYDKRVQAHGKDVVDREMARLGITVGG